MPRSGPQPERKRRIIGLGFPLARRNRLYMLLLPQPTRRGLKMAKTKRNKTKRTKTKRTKTKRARAKRAGAKPRRAKGRGAARPPGHADAKRLQAELAAARERIADLEAREDIDALLDIVNRRGFERVLIR